MPIAIGIVYRATMALKIAPNGKNSNTASGGIEKPIGYGCCRAK